MNRKITNKSFAIHLILRQEMPVITRSQARKQREQERQKMQNKLEQKQQKQQRKTPKLNMQELNMQETPEQRDEHKKQIHEKQIHEIQKRNNISELDKWYIEATKGNLDKNARSHSKVERMTVAIKIYEDAMTCLPLLVEFNIRRWCKYVKAIYDNQYVIHSEIRQQQPLTIEEWCIQTQFINTLQRFQPIVKSLIINFNLQAIVPEIEIKPDLEYVPCEMLKLKTN